MSLAPEVSYISPGGSGGWKSANYIPKLSSSEVSVSFSSSSIIMAITTAVTVAVAAMAPRAAAAQMI